MDLDEAADLLYGGSPEEFVARRTALVKQARQDRDRELATAVGALRRPTRTAWLVNLLAREAAEEVRGLLDLGDALREAQANRDGDGLRRLSTERRRRIDALTRRAVELGGAHGHPPAEGAGAEVAATLQAALGEPAVAAQVRQGRLAAAAVYGGFGVAAPAEEGSGSGDDLLAALAASVPAGRRGAGKAAQEPAAPAEDEVGRRRRAALEKARDAAAAARDAAEAAREEARTEADRATARADGLAEEVERLTAGLARAQAAEQEARDAARAARQHAQEAREAAKTARAAWQQAQEALP